LAQHVSSSKKHNIGVQFIGKSWDRLRSIPVDREGEFVFSLRPRMEQYVDRILCDVQVLDNVKVVTLRSTYKVDNQTLYPVEVVIVDETGHPAYPVQKIGQSWYLALENKLINPC
jgi:vacuolar protein sorting-associated protein 13A/C